jgi:signal transduction histidine kinase
VNRAVKIIDHLREFGRRTEIQKERVDINKPIRGVFTLLEQQLKLRGIEVVIELEKNLPPIMGDANRLEQVFINLVVNARNAMEEKMEAFLGGDVESVLTVRSFRERNKVVVTVTDTGVGIPGDIRDKIFEPFFTTKGVGEGTGLGLSISYRIVRDYDGNIEVKSEVEKGTTFRLTFPIGSGAEDGDG